MPSRFYVALSVDDEPGVLAKIAASFARYQVSIQAVRQGRPGRPLGRGHGWRFSPAARVGDMKAAVEDLAALPGNGGITLMRVEG